jgi:hypothetical protein
LPEPKCGHHRGGGNEKHKRERGDIQRLEREAEDRCPPVRPSGGEHGEEDAETYKPRMIR